VKRCPMCLLDEHVYVVCVRFLELDVYQLQSLLLTVKSITCLSESVHSNERLLHKINDFGYIFTKNYLTTCLL
jgi:hypothetical protein